MLRIPKFDYLAPKTVEEACSLLSLRGEKAMVIAGGTDLLVRMKRREVRPEYLVGLKSIPGLDYVRYGEADGLKIGSLAPTNLVATSPVVQEKFGFLAEAVRKMASFEVRNMGTVGGNLCNAAPSADTAPPLIVLGAKVKLASVGGERVIPLEDFFIGPGQTVLKAGEILTEIQVPNPLSHTGGIYLKLARTAMDLAVVGVAVGIILEDGTCRNAKIVLGAVAPTPMRAMGAEEIIKGKKVIEELIEEASRIASEESRPITDVRGSAEYRKEIVRVFTKRAIRQAIERAKAS